MIVTKDDLSHLSRFATDTRTIKWISNNYYLVGVFNHLEKYWSMGRIIPYIMENYKCSKPPTSYIIHWMPDIRISNIHWIRHWNILIKWILDMQRTNMDMCTSHFLPPNFHAFWESMSTARLWPVLTKIMFGHFIIILTPCMIFGLKSYGFPL